MTDQQDKSCLADKAQKAPSSGAVGAHGTFDRYRGAIKADLR